MVKAWKETVVIPTYEAGEPERLPMFLEKRVYQGSSGAVYPYPVIEKISDEKTDREYEAVFLENEYIKVMILPELGGRVQMAYDKIARRHFVYYNQVIKPALVGLAGPWISGGIEFNWPQHHRPSTFMPVDCTIETGDDGSATVWVSEMERMSQQKGMAGFTLRPGCARLEIRGVLYNRSDMPQTFLWWANPAVAVNDQYQSVFPPDVNAVFDHGKRAVSSFPIATGTYYKMDYSAGVDISNYRNIKVPTSYMAVNSKYDFEGGYENDTRAGMLHVASHHLSPGKKQWTWGNGDFGHAWDRNLTDSDGPYIELMAGVYTENQPDFAWLQPYEEKRFTQYFFPYRELGIVKNASRDYVMNIEPAAGDRAVLKVFATSARHATLIVEGTDGRLIHAESADVTPEQIYVREVSLGATPWSDLRVRIVENGRDALRWSPEPTGVKPLPDAAVAAPEPSEIRTVDRLFLTGQHLEQYRHATFRPTDYYEEALRREPDDVRCNNAMGLWLMRRGAFTEAEKYLRRALKAQRRYNPNPYDGEPVYNLGLSLKYQGRFTEAYDCFAKATWNGAWQDAGYYQCAMMAMAQGDAETALDDVESAVMSNSRHHKAMALKAEILRRMGRISDSIAAADTAISADPFNFAAMWVKWLATSDPVILERLVELMRDCSNNYDQVALEFAWAGAADSAIGLWDVAVERGAVTPMTHYYRAWTMRSGSTADIMNALNMAAEADPALCFPNTDDAVVALRYAIDMNPSDGMARYYLGTLLYAARRHHEAIELWQEAAVLVPEFAGVWRNLALGYFNKLGREDKAVECMERAMSLDARSPRMLMELDQLYRRIHRRAGWRLDRLMADEAMVEERDDLVLEKATLLNLLGRYDEAMHTIAGRKFHPWEGGEGKVTFQYQYCRVELAKQAIADGRLDDARQLLTECLSYPDNLGEGKLYGAQDNDFDFLLGITAMASGDSGEAIYRWNRAASGPSEPVPALYYNDARPDKIFYQGKALECLGDNEGARSRFNRLVAFGEKHLFDKVKLDYFAVSLPDLLIWDDDLDVRNEIHCRYMIALGSFGLGNRERGDEELDKVLSLDPCHQGALALRSMMELEAAAYV